MILKSYRSPCERVDRHVAFPSVRIKWRDQVLRYLFCKAFLNITKTGSRDSWYCHDIRVESVLIDYSATGTVRFQNKISPWSYRNQNDTTDWITLMSWFISSKTWNAASAVLSPNNDSVRSFRKLKTRMNQSWFLNWYPIQNCRLLKVRETSTKRF